MRRSGGTSWARGLRRKEIEVVLMPNPEPEAPGGSREVKNVRGIALSVLGYT